MHKTLFFCRVLFDCCVSLFIYIYIFIYVQHSHYIALKREVPKKWGEKKESGILNHRIPTCRWMWFHYVFSCLWIGYIREGGKKSPRTSPLLLRPGGISRGGMKDRHLIFLSGGTNTKVVLNKKRRKTLRWEKKTEEEFFWCFGVRMNADSIGISLLQRQKKPAGLIIANISSPALSFWQAAN